MALGTATAIGLGAAALGSGLRARSQSKQQKSMQSMYGAPSPLEMWGQNMLMGGSGFNTGQDGMMQAMRSDPYGSSQTQMALSGIIGNQGNPFDTTQLFAALGLQDQRALDSSVADLQAAAPGLGSRFGSANRNAEASLRAQALESMGSRNALIAQQSHGDAQARLLQALGLQQQGGFQQQQQQSMLLQLLLGAQGNRQGMLAQAGGGSPWGQFFGDIGSAAILPGLFGGNAGAGASSQMMGSRYG